MISAITESWKESRKCWIKAESIVTQRSQNWSLFKPQLKEILFFSGKEERLSEENIPSGFAIASDQLYATSQTPSPPSQTIQTNHMRSSSQKNYKTRHFSLNT